jgi:hypothetical protein
MKKHLRTIGQFLVIVSGLVLVLIITLVTQEMAVLWGLVLVGAMMVRVSNNPGVAIRQGLVTLLVNLVVGIIFYFHQEPDVAWLLLATLFLMVRTD